MTHNWRAVAALLLILIAAAAAAPLRSTAAPPSPATDAAPALGSRTQVYIGQGFDTCEIPSFEALQEWITRSPYGAVNLYIGGVARACSNRALTAAVPGTTGRDRLEIHPDVGWPASAVLSTPTPPNTNRA